MALWRPTLVVTVLLCAVLIGGSAEVHAAPKSMPYFPPAMFEGVQTPASTFDLVLAVIDYERGAYSGSESASYDRFFTVMEGTLFVSIADRMSVFQAGQKFSVPAGSSVRLNNGGSKTARIYVSALIGTGSDKLQTAAGTGPSSPPPRVVYTSRMTVRNIPDVVTLVQVGSQFEPGFATGVHVMNHPHAMLHLEGLTSYRYVDGHVETYAAGEGGEMHPGHPGLMSNGGTNMSGFLITWLQTPGTALTTPVDQKVPSWTTPSPISPASTGGSISPPNTGDGGLVAPFQAEVTSPDNGWLALVLVIIVAAVWLPDICRRSLLTDRSP